MTPNRPKIAVVTFLGSLDEHDAAWALAAMDAEPQLVWHAESELPKDTAAVVLPGGFSYGDYLRGGAIARFAPIMEAVIEFAAAGGLVLGICNGFQILCEARLLPGVLVRNASLSFVCRDVVLRVERTDTPFTARCEQGQRLRIPIKHGYGNFTGSDELLAELEEKKQVVLRYHGENPNGSAFNIAGVINEAGNVMGMMPHPEHAVDPLLGSPDGALILASLADAARERSAVLV
ncbi:MAG TPA: phosphoribosylformylglycinamidine synthase subunit PurQ [Gaiellaceae bacterium]